MAEKIGFGKKMVSMVNAVIRGVRPKKYECRFMAPGLTNYPGKGGKGEEMWFLSREVMDRMQESFVGCPVVVQEKHNGDSTPDRFRELAVGVVTEVETKADGWDWCKFIVWDEDTQKKIENDGWNVSCAYNMLSDLSGGVLNAIKYDHEVGEGEYIHLAIVDAPRQTGARILLNSVDREVGGVILFNMNGKTYKLHMNGKTNSIQDDLKAMEDKPLSEIRKSLLAKGYSQDEVDKATGYKHNEDEKTNKGESKMRNAIKDLLVKLNAEEPEVAKKYNLEGEIAKLSEELEIDPEKAIIETPSGDVPLAELVKVYEAEKAEIDKKEELDKANEADKEEEKLNMDSEYKGVKVSEMYEAYKKNQSKKNEDGKEDEAKKNERIAALKSEGKTDEEINALLQSETDAAEKAKEEEALKNEEGKKDDEKKDEEKLNHFNSLEKARKAAPVEEVRILSRRDRIEIARRVKQY